MASITAISRVVPNYRYSQRELADSAESWLVRDQAAQELFKRFCSSALVEQRHFCMPLEEVLSLQGNRQREEIYIKHAKALAEKALLNAINSTSKGLADISTLITTSCTGAIIPAIDAYLINLLRLAPQIERVPIYQQGCVGGAFGLGLAKRLSRTEGLTALLAVEICSLIFQSNDGQAANLVGSAIFADGAACALIESTERGYVIRASRSFLIPNSTHLMGYDTWDDGTHLRLDRELPRILIEYLPEQIAAFLKQHCLALNQIRHWLFHPGGAKILSLLEDSFGLSKGAAHFSRQVLARYGNLSSASILFVLSHFIESSLAKPGEFALMLGIGPGLSAEILLIEYVG